MASKIVSDFVSMYGIADVDADELEAKAVELAGDYSAFETGKRFIEMKFLSVPFWEEMESDWKLVAVTNEGQAAFLRATRSADEAIQQTVGTAYNAIVQAAGAAEAEADSNGGLSLITALSAVDDGE